MTKMRLLTILLFSGISFFSFSQVGIGTNTPNGSSMLDVYSTNKGFLPPRLTSAQISGISSPVAGLTVFCTDCNGGTGCLQIYEGNGWHCGGANRVSQSMCGNTYFYYSVEMAGYHWLDRNIGAERMATSPTDYHSYGMLYQWGRGNDGHQCITWNSSTSGTFANGTTNILCNGGTCPNALFVVVSSSPYDWNSPSIYTLWNESTKGPNDPCPNGYRVPSWQELASLIIPLSNAAGAFNSPARLTLPGTRSSSSGGLINSGNEGYYWSAATHDMPGVNAAISYYITNSNVNSEAKNRALGCSVRCIEQ